ncbi:hypothetical protein [Nostoc sp. C117]|uniref:hypothetical protein n=1 Tax=Nostoc sp. C117 TaxID=3349875 RepID=UPI00370D8794
MTTNLDYQGRSQTKTGELFPEYCLNIFFEEYEQLNSSNLHSRNVEVLGKYHQSVILEKIAELYPTL